MHEYEAKLLSALSKKGSATLEELERTTGLGKDPLLWAIEQLSKKGNIKVSRSTSTAITLTAEGQRHTKEFPEETLVRKLKATRKESAAKINDSIALGWAKKNGWVTIKDGIVSLTPEGLKIASGDKAYQLKQLFTKLIDASGQVQIPSQQADSVKILESRGLIQKKDTPVISVLLVKAGAASGEAEQAILTKEMIASGSWKKQKLRAYDVNAPTEPSYPARLHPVREFINVIRSNWLQMGFVEVSGPIIETAFWNFDALFSPQDHPTREMQDTFFLSNPKQLTIEDVTLLERVKKMHLTGWKEDWSEQVARSTVLRTHTTSVSARYMKKIAETAVTNFPTKMFSIGPVFRNESMDYKHLAELRQYDGIIVGDNLTLANLIHTLKSFYSKLGLDDVRVRPSYFPFTEPSLEFFYYDKEHKDFIELCGGGIIRREITKAMGLNKTVLAWGGGVDRLLLNQKIFGADTLPMLYKNDISWLRSRKNIKV